MAGAAAPAEDPRPADAPRCEPLPSPVVGLAEALERGMGRRDELAASAPRLLLLRGRSAAAMSTSSLARSSSSSSLSELLARAAGRGCLALRSSRIFSRSAGAKSPRQPLTLAPSYRATHSQAPTPAEGSTRCSACLAAAPHSSSSSYYVDAALPSLDYRPTTLGCHPSRHLHPLCLTLAMAPALRPPPLLLRRACPASSLAGVQLEPFAWGGLLGASLLIRKSQTSRLLMRRRRRFRCRRLRVPTR